ncbi:flagellar assembly protein A [Desulfobacula phenolica]|uniref:Response regulatory domain-containing protein n=1 Tax=Desulfobacula phenolica TaxID=90732 RepID=A0A1H2JY64_9BACT|nr:flagellar assembly protein A [Desulfobacula phenolica]SDU61252.1 hypothetical protein SAMN04487931_11729 [Desulfobacula phenolica]
MERKRPKAIILENNDTVREHAKSILNKEGWTVICEQIPEDAMNTLCQASKTIPFALVISNFKLPEMGNNDILQKVKLISPLTQRMLLVSADKLETLIHAVNKANIHACITSPFKDEDLIDQTRNCFRQFKHALKRQQLKRVVLHQNKQLLEITQKLKKKETAYTHLINEKKNQILRLKSKKREIEAAHDLNINISLSRLMDDKGIMPSQDAFKKEFIALYETIQNFFDQLSNKYHSDPINLNLEEILYPEKHDAQQAPQTNQPEYPELIEKILKSAFIHRANTKKQDHDLIFEPNNTMINTKEFIMDKYFEISISEDQTKAYVQKIKRADHNKPLPNFFNLLDLLKQNRICHGILDDESIKAWIAKPSAEKFLIAKGTNPIYGRDAKITFYFKTDFTDPGKIEENGSINFRERGEISHVKKGNLLVQKVPAQDGKPGISIFGVPITVDEPMESIFIPGSGTKISEDGLRLYAAIDGQPHIDALCTVSVNPELVIPGDVDFKTGNINFEGDIIVKGTIKEGFTVKGINLTAREIEGATIDLSGNLKVSAGIKGSSISTHGNLYAKFINHSNIMGFGDLIISKEIIDSDILLSGACLNQTGHIISSQITARLGIEAGNIGTHASISSKLKIGTNDHIEAIEKQISKALKISVDASNVLRDEIKKLEHQDQELYRQISENAHIQDRAQIEIKEFKKNLADIETSTKIEKLIEAVKNSEQELNTAFKIQDKIADKIEQIKTQLTEMEEKNKQLVIKKTALKEFSKKDITRALVTIAKTITQNSAIMGPNSSIIIKEDISRCKIQEIVSSANDGKLHEMNISAI